MNIKKLFTGMLASVMTLTAGIIPDLNPKEIVTAAESQNNSEITAGSSMSGFIMDMMNSGENLNQNGVAETDENYSGDYGITDLEYEASSGTVTLTTFQKERCTAIVGFYTDDGKRMYTSVKADIIPSDETTVLTVNKNKLPDHYYIEAYLVNSLNMPLCYSYCYNNMTEEMQAILAATVDDFDEDLVVQIDETDKTNNFYVMNEDTIVLETDNSKNVLVSADYDTGVFVFDNIDEQMAALQPGDIFHIDTAGDAVQSIVGEISIEGTTAIITQAEDIKDAYSFIKIDSDTLEADDPVVDVNEASDAVTIDSINGCEPVEDENGKLIMGEANTPIPAARTELKASIGGDISFEFKYPPKESSSGGSDEKNKGKQETKFEFSVTANVKINFKAVANVNLYYDSGIIVADRYLSMTVKFEKSTSVSGSLKAEAKLKIPLGELAFSAGPLVFKCEPSFVVSGSAEMGFKYKTSSTSGFTYDRNTGESPLPEEHSKEFEWDVLKIKAFVGVEIKLSVAILDDNIFSIALKAKLGFEITVEDKITLESTIKTEPGQTDSSVKSDKIFKCESYADVDIELVLEISLEFSALGGVINIPIKLVELKTPYRQQYIAVDYNGNISIGDRVDCPFISYRVDVAIKPGKDEKADSEVTVENNKNEKWTLKTDKTGIFSFYSRPGEKYKITAVNGKLFGKASFIVPKYRKYITVSLKDPSQSGTGSGGGWGDDDPGNEDDPNGEDDPDNENNKVYENAEYLQFREYDDHAEVAAFYEYSYKDEHSSGSTVTANSSLNSKIQEKSDIIVSKTEMWRYRNGRNQRSKIGDQA